MKCFGFNEICLVFRLKTECERHKTSCVCVFFFLLCFFSFDQNATESGHKSYSALKFGDIVNSYF